MSVSYGGDSITFADSSTISSGWTGYKNRLINGAMVIDQRKNGVTYPSLGGQVLQFAVDRWKGWCNNGSTANVSLESSTTAPEGFTNSIKATVTAAQTSHPSNFYSMIWQGIEGYNIADLGWGTAVAKNATLSFWVRASVAGSYGGHAVNNTGSSYPFLYTINSPDTWEYKTVVIPGPTSGTWATTTSAGVYIGFSLGAGSTQSGTAATWNHSSSYFYGTTGQTNLFATNGSTLYITGVQFERGSTASSFEWRPYTTELALCQRFYYKSFEQGTKPADSASPGIYGTLAAYSTNNCYLGTWFKFPVTMRTPPTVVATYGINGATGIFDVYNGGWSALTSMGVNTSSSEGLAFYAAKTSGFTQWYSYLFSGNIVAISEF